MAVQEEYGKRGWHFHDTGGRLVGWKNVTLKDTRPGCIAVDSESIVVWGRSCANEREFAEVALAEKYVERVYYIGAENDPEFVAQFLYEALEPHSADEVGEDLDGIAPFISPTHS
ncbi:MAG TPA: hypothetical protein DCR97_10020 [Deltaproteobacteria bacterium]|nr:hypothetical protein [Deltaproteobacteria bacterium]